MGSAPACVLDRGYPRDRRAYANTDTMVTERRVCVCVCVCATWSTRPPPPQLPHTAVAMAYRATGGCNHTAHSQQLGRKTGSIQPAISTQLPRRQVRASFSPAAQNGLAPPPLPKKKKNWRKSCLAVKLLHDAPIDTVDMVPRQFFF